MDLRIDDTKSCSIPSSFYFYSSFNVIILIFEFRNFTNLNSTIPLYLVQNYFWYFLAVSIIINYFIKDSSTDLDPELFDQLLRDNAGL